LLTFAGHLLGLLALSWATAARAVPPQTVYFPSADGRTELVGYLFEPAGQGPHRAVVMLHGRAGPYSSNVNSGCTLVARGQSSRCNGLTLSKRHAMWGEYWAAHGAIALLVDSFGPRGRAHGYGRYTHGDPEREAVNERTVRPLDAEGALAWLASQPGARGQRVMLQGWSNGASTALNVMYRQAQAATHPAGAPRFAAALVLYPGCGSQALLSQRYEADAPIQVLLGGADEEVSPTVCANVLRKAQGGPVEVTLYDGATHDFDDPGASRQDVAANRVAAADALRRAAESLETLR
jgi:dienelactone hydrolase